MFRRASATHLFVDIAAMHAAEGGVSALISEISKTESVTKEEFTAFLKANKMTDEMDSEEVSGLFDSMDTNSNGEITKVEFAKWFGENKDVEERLHLQAKSEFAEFEEVEEDVLSQVKKLRVEAFLDHTSRPYVESTEVWRGTPQHTNWPVYIYIHTYIYMCVCEPIHLPDGCAAPEHRCLPRGRTCRVYATVYADGRNFLFCVCVMASSSPRLSGTWKRKCLASSLLKVSAPSLNSRNGLRRRCGRLGKTA